MCTMLHKFIEVHLPLMYKETKFHRFSYSGLWQNEGGNIKRDGMLGGDAVNPDWTISWKTLRNGVYHLSNQLIRSFKFSFANICFISLIISVLFCWIHSLFVVIIFYQHWNCVSFKLHEIVIHFETKQNKLIKLTKIYMFSDETCWCMNSIIYITPIVFNV